MAVLRPLKVVIDELPRGQGRGIRRRQQSRGPRRPGTRKVPFSRELYIERDDFMEDPPKKFFRLAPGPRGPAALRLFHQVRGGRQGRGDRRGHRAPLHLRPGDPRRRRPRRPQGQGHPPLGLGRATPSTPRSGSTTRCSRSATPATSPRASIGRRTSTRSRSRSSRAAKVEPALAAAAPGSRWQFERLGYFCADLRDSKPGAPVFNRTVTLRDEWARLVNTGRENK